MKISLTILVLLISISCSHLGENKVKVSLTSNNWTPSTKQKLETLISEESGTGKVVIFDFDNTLICRDIGEATLGTLTDQNKINKSLLQEFLSPGIKTESPTKYYDQLLSSTEHHTNEQTAHANGYAWAVQAMAGLSPIEIINATEKAFKDGSAQSDRESNQLSQINVTNEENSFARPYFYPEMVELVAKFLENDYNVYVVSASNVWTVRWMVNQLNNLIKKQGIDKKISLKNVLGVSTLLVGKNGKLFKDQLLTHEVEGYADLKSKLLKDLKLSAQISYPLTGYYGKIANIKQWITKDRPYFIAGDSPNDLPMLETAENKLWIARLEKPNYQNTTKSKGFENLIIQPTLYKKMSGFVGSEKSLNERIENLSVSTQEKVRESWNILF